MLTMGPQGRISLFLLLATTAVMAGAAKVEYMVECQSDAMVVRVPAAGVTSVELERWGKLPQCASVHEGSYWTLTLPYDDHPACGITKIKNKISGKTVFYHRVALTTAKERHVVLVKCNFDPHSSPFENIVKRDVLPPEFVEPDYIEITSEVTGTAPVPILNVGVRQNGNLVDGEINVRPGTPLTMEVYLDNTSAGTYGILMSYMEVTDDRDKRETIIFNGCSVDPVLFDNFITTSGDSVSAKFRAFKFPETNYVLFRGTVDVCLDKCQGIACSNGQLGFGRRRRGIDSRPNDPNKIFEVTMMTYLKVDENLNETISGAGTHAKALRESIEESLALDRAMTLGSSASVAEEPLLIQSSGDEPSFIFFNGAHTHIPSALFVVVSALLLFLYN
ncbi:uncharacterized protein LOC122254328 [Penaeus japonicus]|uniref:uncharacterized protein LOC122254328 n=1 Tax=Penaeus japonicus TaxID=27405 RepID=UPI001C714B3A|nr:uncharacterized protein LOC122254328 [Penaeus japonicus]